MARRATRDSTDNPEPASADGSASPFAILPWFQPMLQWQSQWLPQSSDGETALHEWMKLWTQQLEAFNAAWLQVIQQQQAMFSSWQELGAGNAREWRERAEQALRSAWALPGNDSGAR